MVRRNANDYDCSSSQQRLSLRLYNPHGQSVKVHTLVSMLRETRRNNNHLIQAAQEQCGQTKKSDMNRKVNPNKLPGFIKSVVFSQFTEFLTIIQNELEAEGFSCLRFDGSMNQAERSRVLSCFKGESEQANKDGKVYEILLISLKAGGVGLNLVCAQQVFLMDPWWSYAVEAQAIDRIHRMGQQNTVKVYRMIVENSVEENILKIQEKKKALASSLGQTEEEKKTQRLNDIITLLN